ncbi:MAG TPA: 4Fe-4S dicluster domain-containing protein, partial [Planctomycetaceae bacterium]|nr:4Fe-4S dicluster domain-containing protein [Planctomycetaceae bacterium]
LLRRTRAGMSQRLRPPGAGPEPAFLAACIRCGQCVEACPDDVLRPADIGSGLAAGTPYWVAREKPCNLCQGRRWMECIAACPTGALAPLCDRRRVRMGLAVVDPRLCLPWNGVACKACWHACPFPDDAIRLNQRGRPVVIEEGCVGCGLCEYACLTDVPAIRVRPRRQGSPRAVPSPGVTQSK